MVDPAVNGTLSAMNSALKNHVVRIVVTSSINAITDQPLKRYTEDDWNTLSSYKRNAYHYSKVMSERTAWKFIEEHQADVNCPELVTILVRRQQHLCIIITSNIHYEVISIHCKEVMSNVVVARRYRRCAIECARPQKPFERGLSSTA